MFACFIRNAHYIVIERQLHTFVNINYVMQNTQSHFFIIDITFQQREISFV